jgi:AcrR family transcriptional regulator
MTMPGWLAGPAGRQLAAGSKRVWLPAALRPRCSISMLVNNILVTNIGVRCKRDDDTVTEPEPDWRQRKKTATRDRIRTCALRLFGEQGYDGTTVEQIAAAAGVSHVTFFRYFPAKEDVALSDSYDPLIASYIAQTPAAWPLLQRIRAALVHGLRQLYDADRDALLAQNRLIVSTPALRERLWASQLATQQAILLAIGADRHDPRASFRAKVTVAACLAAATTAVLTWVENDGTPDLPDLMEQAFDALTRPQ